jgi:hypothetical protein
MTYSRSILPGSVPVILLAGMVACSAGDLVLPQDANEVQLGAIGGNQQTGTVGEPLPKPLTIELRDEQGHAIVGRRVAFAVVGGPDAATLTPDTAVTDGDGEVLGQWVLGRVSGVYTAEARVLPVEGEAPGIKLPVAQFTASARAGPPDTLRAVSKTTQVGDRGEPVDEAPVVRVVDRYGNPIEGVAVHWEVVEGEAQVSSATTTTGTDGRTSVTWILNSRGGHRLEAHVDGKVNGSPTAFIAFVSYFN